MSRLAALLLGIVFLLPAPAFADTPLSRLVNISVRNHVGTGDNVLIAGFVIVGDGNRPMLIRGIGPTLSAFNVSSPLADPVLRLYDSQNHLLVENDNWDGTTPLSQAFASVGAFPLPTTSLDAAISKSLSAGSYTCISLGKQNATGEALLELYDGLPISSSGHALANLSLRGTLEAGGNFIAGFVISGTKPKTVLLRAAGPSLANFGITSPHPNPTISLFQDNRQIGANDDWSESADPAAIASAAKRFGAFPFAASSPDAALLCTLLPGNYSVHVHGVAPDQSGTILVEIYDTDFAPQVSGDPQGVPAPSLPSVSITGPIDDPNEGESSTFTLKRTGSLAADLTVHLTYSGTATSDSDYVALPSSFVIPAGTESVAIPVSTKQDSLAESTESVEAILSPDSTYNISPGGGRGVILIHDAPLSNTGWTATFYNNLTWSGNPVLTRNDSTIDFDWGNNSPGVGVRADQFTARWQGVLTVDTTQVYHFLADADDGVMVWVDDQPVIYRPNYAWEPISGGILLEANTRHTIRVDFVEQWGTAKLHLYWFTNGIVRQIVPSSNVSPQTTVAAALIGPIDTTAVAGVPLLIQLTSIGVTSGYSVSGLPPGLGLDPSTGQIGGTLSDAGDYEFSATGSNATGAGSTRVRIHVVKTDSEADTEIWQGDMPSDSILPLSVSPDRADVVHELASPGDATSAFGRRIRGSITAPATGNFIFWIKGGGRAEFWMADSNQPADRILRCSANNATGWNTSPTQKSTAMALKAGEKYYFEVIQAGAASTDDNVAVGWIMPGSASAIPFEVVPGSVLSHWSPSITSGSNLQTVYVGALRPPTDVTSLASGTASVSYNETTGIATVSVHLTGLSSAVSAARLLLSPGDINETRLLNLTGSLETSFTWTPGPSGKYTLDQVTSALKSGNVYVRVETAKFPAGELLAPLLSTLGASTFVPPETPSPVPASPLTEAQASRFLTQATFGPTTEDIAHLRQIGYDAWFDEQWSFPASTNIASIDAQRAAAKLADPKSDVWTDAFVRSFWKNTVEGKDQLRQRMAFALSEIFVVSLDSAVSLDAGTTYYDNLVKGAEGTYRNLLETITKNPGMGVFLSMIKNQKTDLSRGIYPDENYAREIMQLFSIGLNKLHPDGTLMLDTDGLPVPTYTQEAIVGLAKVFTGWSYASTAADYNYFWGAEDYRHPMQLYPTYHDRNPKRLIESVILPEGGDGESEMGAVMDMLANHPNTGPFICKQLIQRLVTANPSPAYVYRVAKVFSNNGSGARGDLKAVAKAILMDPEARRAVDYSDPTRGKLREPLLRITQLWRAFHARAKNGKYELVWIRDYFGQEPMNSPTVFNFFQPAYAPTGPISKAGLKAPEFQITTESTTGNLANYLEYLTGSWGDDDASKVALDLTEASAAYAKGPDELLNLYASLLLAGDMPADLRVKLKAALSHYDSWVVTSDRLRWTLHILLCSPEYVIER